MMTWLAAALLAAFLWSIVSLVDKVAVERYVPTAVVYLFFTGLSTLLPITLIPIFASLDSLPLRYVLLSMLTGFLFLSATYMYFASLEISDAPVVTNLLLLVPIFSTALGYIFFSERFTAIVYIGIAAVLVGAFIVSVEEGGQTDTPRGRRLSAALGLMVVYAILTSIDYSLQKYLLTITTEVTFFFWARMGDFLFAVLLIGVNHQARADFVRTLKGIPKTILSISFLNEVLNLGATYSVVVAYAAGPLALVSTALSAQPLFVLLLIPVINAVKKDLIPHKGVGRALFLLRGLAILVTIAGVYLISLAQ